ncbi:autotransporter outer membrane beta-barrel domain-containing protein, partial [Helicobacter pametensis]
GGGGGGGYSAEANTTSGVNKLSDQTLKLVIDGGITAIGHDGGKSKTGGTTTTTTEIKAKSFKFGATSNLASINGTLKLNTKEDSELEIKGTTVLKGTNTAEAKIEVVKTNGAQSGSSIGTSSTSSTSPVKLKLHDIQSEGKGSITNAGLAFVDSNITAKGTGTEARSLTLTDNTIALIDLDPSTPQAPQTREVKNQMEGTIASITLDHADLEFKRKTGTQKTPTSNSNDASTASIKLNAGSFIKATGDSSLKVKSLYVGENSTDRFSLEVKQGTFTLKEENTQNQIGDITLNKGDFVFEKTGAQPAQKTESKTYHDLKLQGNLTSEGDSSIKVNQIISTQKPNDAEVKNYMISSKGGELRFNLQTKEGQTLQNDFTLDHGGISFYDANSQLMDGIVLKDSSITASGDSSIKAKEIDFSGAKISASGGTLKIEGIKTNTYVGDVSVGDSGVLDVRNSVGSLATLKIKEDSRVTLSAHAPYLSPSEPLGGGKFGKIVVDKLIFESTSGENKLINIAITTQERSIAKAKDDSLFALREGVVTLIDTQNGIKKKVGNAKYDNITLQDISIDKGGYTSVTLTPELIKDKTLLGEEIIRQLNLGIHVSQKTVPELMESIKDPKNKQIMEQIFKDPLHVAIVESILQSQENVFKVGIAEYISSGNVEIVDTTLRYMREAFQGATEGIYASDRIARELKMLRDSNLENRMVRSGNPYVSKTEIASLLDSIKGVRYASDDDGILLDGYSGPNYGSLWASYEGATSFGALENASVNGLSAGYDTLVGDQKEYLLGFYANYGYGTYGSSFVKNNSHNFGLGFYTRMTFDRNEVDLVISQNIGLNHSDLNLGASQALSVQYLNQTLKYNFYITDAQVRYGYLIPVGDKESPFYFKPFGGIDFGFNVNGEMRGDGVAPIGIDQALHFKLNVAVGLEMKKYFNEGSYIYLLPILEKGLFNDGNVINLGFIGANKIPYAQFYQVDTSLGLYAGGQGSVGNNVSITGGLGVKMNVESKDVLTNWNIGFKYKF